METHLQELSAPPSLPAPLFLPHLPAKLCALPRGVSPPPFLSSLCNALTPCRSELFWMMLELGANQQDSGFPPPAQQVRAGDRSSSRVEVKNLNSIRSVARAVEHEAARHAEALQTGQDIGPETRGFDAKTGKTVLLRGKEGKLDYRFMVPIPPRACRHPRAACWHLPCWARAAGGKGGGLRAPCRTSKSKSNCFEQVKGRH